ncbi:TetR/AcrR family transcriptional regulator [Rhodococcus sp. AD45-ID]|uniref:TetR/AcrR family transcriptional regulator n=1 Tax=unclassified Rhodococcus (in: high G+C Gram-positive bacteria) TaxID=192944 RepID=UPI0005D33905|nr:MULTISPECIES: TetR/AcrR family transcriptional regulator [unclassified Rhodococcus (in: high G+C Gram-positive bacteria)]KJF19701.1 HTH-type transcriptional repressor KstR [Rhodococcus sp. AD45]PSR40879.1 TetR/AcrR family transcriptional regulator [Rhodococcus sp. AD45-ID]RZL24169.1 MAG: TetR/AcrR family transcriptional regulator [Rhodococcus sp. (in: high G+C Gram-positive bacteria)]
MSGKANFESTRRRLSGQQAETVDRLTKAAVAILRTHGFSALTIRMVASEAGVAPATAYTYFSSKSHLVAELFWRRLDALPHEADAEQDRESQVCSVLRSVALLVSDEPELAAAVTTAMMADDPDVEHLRARIGKNIRERLVEALGPEHDADVLEALEIAWSGALVRAGMGYESYSQIADRLEITARLIMAGHDNS